MLPLICELELTEQSLARLAQKLISSNLRILPTSKRIRAIFDKKFVLDSVKAKYVWEIPNYPQQIRELLLDQLRLTSLRLYFPLDGVTNKARLDKADAVEGTENRVYYGKLSTETESTRRILIFGDNAGSLAGLVKVDWRAMGDL